MVKIKSYQDGEYQIVEVGGEIDASSSIQLDTALKQAISSSDKVLVDLSPLEYISSAGLGVFISYLEDLKSNGTKMALYGLKSKVREVFEILGLQHLISISENRKEAQEIIQ